MISNKLLKLYHTALEMEKLLPTSNRTYKTMYNTLEHDLDIALDGVAQRMIEKYNIPTNKQCDSCGYVDGESVVGSGCPFCNGQVKLESGENNDPPS